MNDTQPVSAEPFMSTPVVAVTAEHSLAAAGKAMRRRQVRHLVVLDQLVAAVARDAVTVASGSRAWKHGDRD